MDGPLSPRRGSDGAGVPFDDLPISGAGGGGYQDNKHHSSGKKVAKVELVHHASYDDRIGHNDGNDDAYADAKFDEDEGAGAGAGGYPSARGGGGGGAGAEDDRHLPYTDRVIRPKNTSYEEALGGIDDDPNTFKQGGNAPKPAEQFPPGEHPLEDVANFLTLPSPEALAKKSR